MLWHMLSKSSKQNFERRFNLDVVKFRENYKEIILHIFISGAPFLGFIHFRTKISLLKSVRFALVSHQQFEKTIKTLKKIYFEKIIK